MRVLPLLAVGIAARDPCYPAPLVAHDFPQFGDELFRPRLRQPGKDAVAAHARRDGRADAGRGEDDAGTTSSTILAPGMAAYPSPQHRRFGATAVGIEYDAGLAALARRSAERAGVADKVTMVQGDIFKEDFSRATVVTLYLLPDLNQQLRPRLLAMKPGTRVVSHAWDMGEWEPDATFRTGESEAFLWIVPAWVEGRWALQDEGGFFAGEVALTQRFQRIGGTLTLRGRQQPALGAYVEGENLGFTFVDPDGGVRSVRARIGGRPGYRGRCARGLPRPSRHRTPAVIRSGSPARLHRPPHVDPEPMMSRPITDTLVRRALAPAGFALAALAGRDSGTRRSTRPGR